jgi:hypothetical protein
MPFSLSSDDDFDSFDLGTISESLSFTLSEICPSVNAVRTSNLRLVLCVYTHRGDI